MKAPTSIMHQSRSNDEAYDIIMTSLQANPDVTVHELEVAGEHLQKELDNVLDTMRVVELQLLS